jgi:hypothetical protein
MTASCRFPEAAHTACCYDRSAFRTSGATIVPRISIARISLMWSITSMAIWIRKRSNRKISCAARILSVTSAGLPTNSAPRGPRADLGA